jgi:O-antigen/teichoic acid export membrane protein
MSARRLILKSGATLGFGQVVSQACSFVRNIIIARLISPPDFGIAATFAVTISVFELMSNLSMDKLLIQAEDGNGEPFQQTAQLLQAARGLVNALFIFLLGGPIAYLFGEPRARWAFFLLALVPLLRGFIHLDTSRFQRGMRFLPAVTVDVCSQVLVTVVALPLAFWLRDYTAMLWILILQAASSTIISHVVSERPYRWRWEKSYARRIASFGWPLLINGLLLFVILDGDRFIIGSAHRLFPRSSLTLADLGIYSVAFALTMAPTMFVANIGTSVLLPHLSRVQGARSEFEHQYSSFAQITSLAAAAVCIPFISAGWWVVVVVYGVKYAMAAPLIAWLAAMWGLRMIRVTPTIGAMALGDTQNAMFSNVARTTALAGILIAIPFGAGLQWIAACGFVGEILALATCVVRLSREHGIQVSRSLKPLLPCLVGAALAGGLSAAGITTKSPIGAIVASVVLVGAVGLIMLLAFPTLRSQLRGLDFRPVISVAKEQAAS